MKIFESHAHLDFPDFDNDREDILRKCRETGIERIINIGIDEPTSRASLSLSESHPEILAAVGYHPAECPSFNKKTLLAMIAHPSVRAIGEIGLDYHHEHHPRHLQIKVFEEQVRIAIEHNLPIVVHNREAHTDCLCILEAYHPQKVVFHCFSGNEDFAERVFSHGWMISFTGNVTYKNNSYAPIIRMAPDNAYMIETDCPFMAPVPYRGQRNAPYFLPSVITAIAAIRGVSGETVAEQTWNNGISFFGV